MQVIGSGASVTSLMSPAEDYVNEAEWGMQMRWVRWVVAAKRMGGLADGRRRIITEMESIRAIDVD